MYNETTEPQEVREAKEILSTTPVLKKGDKVSYRKLAENLAQLSGDTSEENVQKYLRAIDWKYERPRATPKERRYKIIGWVLFFCAILSVLAQILGLLEMFNSVGLVFACFGVVFWIVGERERARRINKNLPRSVRLKF